MVVDWSASSRPRLGEDSVWIASITRSRPSTGLLENLPTRGAARERLAELLAVALAAGERSLVGYDFPLGFPAGFAQALGLKGLAPWRQVWNLLRDQIADLPDNTNNRFEVAAALNERVGAPAGPFWGRPARSSSPSERLLASKKTFEYPVRSACGVALDEWRSPESALRATRRYPQPCWKLMGQGSVGSQALTGIPVVAALRDDPDLSSVSLVWPFETGAGEAWVSRPLEPRGARPPMVVHAEVWPPMHALLSEDRGTGSAHLPGRQEVRDAQQVSDLARALARLDGRGGLAGLLAPPLDGDVERTVLDEEGWVLGATPPCGALPRSSRPA